MSRIEKLIRDYCPGGVEYMSLGDFEDKKLLKLGRGNVISKTDLQETPGDYPVYSSSAVGVGEFGRYGMFMFDDERITWSVDGGGKFFYRPAHKYSVTNVCGWISILDSSVLSTKFLYYALMNIWTKRTYNYTVKAHPSVIRVDYVLPLPPLEVQQEIVRILDSFTQLEAELEAELEARKKQYEHYRNTLLTFPEQGGVRWVPMGRLCHIKTGGAISKAVISASPGEYPVINSGKEPLGFYSLWNVDDNPLGITSRGAGVGSITWSSGKYFRGNLNYSATISNPRELDSRYLYHWLTANQASIHSMCTFDGIPALNKSKLETLEIPVPHVSQQLEIANTLDSFEEFTSGLSSGLPAEIDARRKQYEHYRDKLLTFKELYQ